MSPSVTATLRTAIRQLEAERKGIEQQIRAIQSALGGAADRGRRATAAASRGPKPTSRRMSAAARRAVSARMKAYWAKRRAAKPKGTAKP